MSASAPAARAGLFASLRRLLGTGLELAQVRLDLLVTELEQEKLRLFDVLLWATLAVLMFGIGAVLLCGLLLLLLWDGHRLVLLGVLSLLFFGAGAVLLWTARRRLSAEPMLAGTRAELARDRGALAPGP